MSTPPRGPHDGFPVGGRSFKQTKKWRLKRLGGTSLIVAPLACFGGLAPARLAGLASRVAFRLRRNRPPSLARSLSHRSLASAASLQLGSLGSPRGSRSAFGGIGRLRSLIASPPGRD